jgi:ABC-type uncharacterized transport system substrate-binding protein
VDGATTAQLPVACAEKEFVVIGCLLACGPKSDDMLGGSAIYGDRIPEGTRPSGRPVEPSATVELIVDHRRAKALGLTIPRSILPRETEFVE